MPVTNQDLQAQITELKTQFTTQISEVKESVTRLNEKTDAMNGSLRGEIGTYGAIVMDLQKEDIERKAIENYKATQANKDFTRSWTEVAKQLMPILVTIGVILYAYAATKGIK